MCLPICITGKVYTRSYVHTHPLIKSIFLRPPIPTAEIQLHFLQTLFCYFNSDSFWSIRPHLKGVPARASLLIASFHQPSLFLSLNLPSAPCISVQDLFLLFLFPPLTHSCVLPCFPSLLFHPLLHLHIPFFHSHAFSPTLVCPLSIHPRIGQAVFYTEEAEADLLIIIFDGVLWCMIHKLGINAPGGNNGMVKYQSDYL